MPGVMIIEALAQTAGILAFVTAGVVPDENTRFYFVGIDKARFRKPVEPGDQLILTATLERAFKGIWKFSTVRAGGRRRSGARRDDGGAGERQGDGAPATAVIDPRAIVSPKAELAPDVTVGAVLRSSGRTWSSARARVDRARTWSSTARRASAPSNRIFQFASIGDAPQDKKYKGEPTRLEIGDRNVFRESCTINRGTTHDKGVTTIGNDNLFMAYSHVAHDCVLGSNLVFANCATLGGHVEIGDWVILGGMAAIHQFCKIGAHAFIAGGAIVTRDVPPYVMVAGNPAAAARGQCRRAQAPRLHAGPGAQHPQRVPGAVSLRPAAGGCGGAAHGARQDAARSGGVRRVHRPSPSAASCAEARAGEASLRVGVVAGEASGDTLGAALITALRARVPDVAGSSAWRARRWSPPAARPGRPRTSSA